MLLPPSGKPDARLRDLATALNVTERTAYGIVDDLVDAGYLIKQRVGRGNTYSIQEHLPLPYLIGHEPTVGQVLEMLGVASVMVYTPASPIAQTKVRQ